MRSAVEREAQGGAGDDRAYFPLRHDLARADPGLYRRGSLALALQGRGFGAFGGFPRRSVALARRGAGEKMERYSRDPRRRHRRAGGRARGETHWFVAGGGARRAYFRRQALRGARWNRFRRSLHHLRHPRGDRRRGAAGGVPIARGQGRRRVVRARARRQMRAVMAIFRSRRRRSGLSRRNPARRAGAA